MSEENQPAGFDNQITENLKHQWAVVEIMGHNLIAGRVTEAALLGGSMLRVDVPSVDGAPGFTKFFGSQAIYAVSPTSRQVVEELVRQYRPKPIQLYLPAGPGEQESEGEF